ncbi:MAG: methyltransferase domain-containing protein [Acidobacteriota bacterium]|nr:methyltransferase domain-containing protein [Acidobacteriota bacterium]
MPQLLCTVRTCHLPLNREERCVVCPRGHAFDIARSGYINLLQPQERRSRNPGDSEEAVAARRRFLDRGHAEALLAAVRGMIPDTRDILDAGCGEGYYLGSIGHGCGIDISTAAIELAARRYPRCEWIVTNADRFIPYADASFDLVMSITGRMNAGEFRRVLREDGFLLVAVSAPDDLIELRGRGRDRVERTIASFSDFVLIKQERVTAVVELTGEEVMDLRSAVYRPGRAGEGARHHTTNITLSLDLLLFRVSGSAK